MLPFTIQQFDAVFAAYNEAIWPAQAFAYLLGGLAVILLFGEGKQSDRIIAIILATMWAWTGVAYHLAFFAVINKGAYLFGALFIAEACALAYSALGHRLSFGFRYDTAGWVGIAFLG